MNRKSCPFWMRLKVMDNKVKIIKIGICGYGWIARKTYLPLINERSDMLVTDLLETSPQAITDIKKESPGLRVHMDLESFLESDTDAILVLSPNFTHVDYTMRALVAGKHVLCEKPLAFSGREIQEVVECAWAGRLVYLPGFANRFRQDISAIKQMLVDGCIGKVVSINADWIRKSGIPRPGTWFTNRKKSGGGVLIDLGSHIIDICLWWLNFPSDDLSIEKASLTTMCHDLKSGTAEWFDSDENRSLPVDVEDNASIILKSGENQIVKTALSWFYPAENDYTCFSITGTEGKIELKTLFGFSRNRLWNDDILTVEAGGKVQKKILDKQENNSYNAFRKLINLFGEKIKGAAVNSLSADEAGSSVSLIERIYESAGMK